MLKTYSKKTIQFIFLISFFLLISAFFWGKAFTHIEKELWLQIEAPVEFPPLNSTADKISFFSKLDQYIETNFPLQKTSIKLFNFVHFNVFREKYSNDVLLGKDNWLFINRKNMLSTFQRTRANQATAEYVYGEIQIINEYAEQRNMKLVMILAPDKATIYPELFMEGIERLGEYQLAELVLKLNEENKNPLTLIYPKEELTAAKESNPMFYSADIHWTNYAGLTTLEKLIPILDNPAQIELMNNLSFIKKPYTRLGLDWGMLGVDIWGLDIKQSSEDIFVENSSAVEIPTATNCPETATAHYQLESPSLENAIFIYDSFGAAVEYFLPDLFSNVIGIYLNRCDYPNTASSINDLANDMQIDYLIIVVNERSLHSRVSHLSLLSKAIQEMGSDKNSP